MGKKKAKSSSCNKRRSKPNHKKQEPQSSSPYEWNFVSDAGPGCYIARRDLSSSSSSSSLSASSSKQQDEDWVIGWEDVDPHDFRGMAIPDIALDDEEQTVTVCNVKSFTQIAYVTIYESRLLGKNGQKLTPGSTTDNDGKTRTCTTFIVLVPPKVFAHLCYLDLESGQDISSIQIESDVREWSKHPHPRDEHPQRIGFPLQGGPFLCTQGEEGELTHFFSGNLHAIDFRCPIGTPLIAVGDGTVVEAKDTNTLLTGIAVSNLFEWNSILVQLDPADLDQVDPLFVEYVHIKKSLVKAGDRITKGQLIGESGSVGFSPEPHLHFSAFRSSDPKAPTVRVQFIPNKDGNERQGGAYLPRAGRWYDENGLVQDIPAILWGNLEISRQKGAAAGSHFLTWNDLDQRMICTYILYK